MLTMKYTYQSKKTVLKGSKPFILPSVDRGESQHFKSLIHRRTEEIYRKVRETRSRLTTNGERLVFDYICDSTLRRGKATDQIANSQFTRGKRNTKTGHVLDFGCGLKSLKPIREARKSLVLKGIIFEEAVTDLCGMSAPNRYGLMFIRDLLELHQSQKRCVSLEKHTPRGYYEKHPTYEYPTDISKQRCTTADKSNQKRKHKHFMDSIHVDYFTDLIEQGTGDTHSRGAFAQIALSVPEGRIMELLSVLKDRTDIKNKGAWFLAVARKYQTKRIIRADDPEPPTRREEREQAIPVTVSFKDLMLARKPDLADLLDMNSKLQIPATHHKFITGT